VQLVCFPFPLPPSYYCAPLFKPFPFLPPSLPSSLLLCLLSLDATLHSNRGRIPRLGGSLYFPLACPTAILLLFRFLFSNPSLPPSLLPYYRPGSSSGCSACLPIAVARTVMPPWNDSTNPPSPFPSLPSSLLPVLSYTGPRASAAPLPPVQSLLR